jgi:fatty acid desaturase
MDQEHDEIASIRAAFNARGWNRKATLRVLSELLLHIAVAGAGLALFLRAEGLWLRALGFLVLTVGTTGVATNTHTSSHGATSDRRWVNDLLTYFGYPFFLQVSATYWRHAHLVVHHPAPNVMGLDDDADFAPFFASTDREVAASRGWFRRFIRVQWLFFPLIVWVNVFLRQRAGWLYLVRVLRDPSRRRAAHVWDLVALVLHWVAFGIVPAFFFPITHVIEFNLLRIAVLGYPIFCVLAPGHYPADARVVARGDWPKDAVLLQTANTANFRAGGPLGRLLCSGLDYQVEHHLFPGYSHVYYRAMSPTVRRFCERGGYAYHSLGWAEALWKTCLAFYRPKVVASDLEEIRYSPRAGQRAKAVGLCPPDATVPSMLRGENNLS